jgi:hypothetical protein
MLLGILLARFMLCLLWIWVAISLQPTLYTLQSWRWKRHIPPKVSIHRPSSIITQKATKMNPPISPTVHPLLYSILKPNYRAGWYSKYSDWISPGTPGIPTAVFRGFPQLLMGNAVPGPRLQSAAFWRHVSVMRTVFCPFLSVFPLVRIGLHQLLSSPWVRPPMLSSGQSSWLQIQRPGFDSRRYHIFWEVMGLERGPLSLVSTIEELLERNSNSSGLKSREYSRRDPSRWPRGTLYQQKFSLTLPASCRRSVGIVRSRTRATKIRLLFSSSCGIWPPTLCQYHLAYWWT